MKKITLAALFLMLTASSVSAAATEIKVEKNFSNNLITISGKATANESVAFQVLPDGISLADFAASSTKEDIIAFVYEELADEDGNFSVTAKLKASGIYNVFSATEDKEKAVEAIENVPFYTSEDYTAIVNQLNDTTNLTDFVNVAKSNKEALGFDESINSTVNIDDTLKFLYQNSGITTLEADEYVKNVYLYKNSFAALALNGKKITNAYEYVKNIIDEDGTLKKYWEQYITDEEREKQLFSKISGKNIGNINDLKTKIVEGLILTATKYPNGYMSLKDLYSDYKNIIGLGTISAVNAVYSSIGSKDYISLNDLKLAYNNAVSANAATGGGGGQTVTTGSSFGGVIASTPGSSITPQTSLTLAFQDLSAFEWAYPSISILYEAGIVSGMSEVQFAPSKQVKREEFIKMIVCAMGLETNLGDRFSDVDNSAWYAPYVYTAYNNNLVNGISKTEFGVSKDISRQDMAVMIFNAIRAKGYASKNAELAFDDKDSISDYAKEAVAELSTLGIINGMGDGRFAPSEKATRAQAAVIIERALNYLGQ